MLYLRDMFYPREMISVVVAGYSDTIKSNHDLQLLQHETHDSVNQILK